VLNILKADPSQGSPRNQCCPAPLADSFWLSLIANFDAIVLGIRSMSGQGSMIGAFIRA
jgi:hypothetical protein